MDPELYSALLALGQVIIIDLVLAGDNAIVVGMAAAGLPKEQRGKVILVGIAAATALRIFFALITTQLLLIIGLTLAGGLLLLWVCWKFWREIMDQRRERLRHAAMSRQELSKDERRELAEHPEALPGASPAKTMRQAIIQIVIADVSMSLDNVLAVAGAARGEVWVLVVGLTVAVVCMAVLSAYIAKLLARHHWITWVGLLIVLTVAAEMIWSGTHQVGCEFVSKPACESGGLATLLALLS